MGFFRKTKKQETVKTPFRSLIGADHYSEDYIQSFIQSQKEYTTDKKIFSKGKAILPIFNNLDYMPLDMFSLYNPIIGSPAFYIILSNLKKIAHFDDIVVLTFKKDDQILFEKRVTLSHIRDVRLLINQGLSEIDGGRADIFIRLEYGAKSAEYYESVVNNYPEYSTHAEMLSCISSMANEPSWRGFITPLPKVSADEFEKSLKQKNNPWNKIIKFYFRKFQNNQDLSFLMECISLKPFGDASFIKKVKIWAKFIHLKVMDLYDR